MDLKAILVLALELALAIAEIIKKALNRRR